MAPLPNYLPNLSLTILQYILPKAIRLIFLKGLPLHRCIKIYTGPQQHSLMTRLHIPTSLSQT